MDLFIHIPSFIMTPALSTWLKTEGEEIETLIPGLAATQRPTSALHTQRRDYDRTPSVPI